MVKVLIVESLFNEIKKKFNLTEANEILDLLGSLESSPQKGKEIGVVGNIVIKELKYKKFRFYFITDGYKIKYLQPSQLTELLIKFVRMSEKKDQQKTIEEIKIILRRLGEEGFN